MLEEFKKFALKGNVVDLAVGVIIGAAFGAIVSWLVGFGVINTHNQIARVVVRVLHALTEPVFGPIRRVLPSMGGLDLSPLVALLLIFFIQRLPSRHGVHWPQDSCA